jgi:Type I phosphodiesterase / nucleotide pyrophosphatase
VQSGTVYTDARTSSPSDSFPGLLAQLTGGTPKSTGVFYDNSYDRSMWAPGSNCQGPAGTNTVYDESIDKVDGSGNIPLFTSIDPTTLPMGKVNGVCQPIYPHSFLKTNTIFNVAHDAGMYTAWSDKHPAYEIVRGPRNTGCG